MLNEIFLEAIRNREKTLSKIKDNNYEKIMVEASSRWVQYNPSQKECKSAGVDTSWNKRGFQGLDLYAIAAVAVSDTSKRIAMDWKHEIISLARAEKLEPKAMAMEAEMAYKAALDPNVDIVFVDGSIVARITAGAMGETDVELIKKYNDAISKYDDTIFVAKTSNSRLQFEDFRSMAGDIYYYNHVGKSSGFSRPQKTRFPNDHIFEIYARLKDHTTVIRIEIDDRKWGTSESEIKGMLDMLSYHSVAGYPYCLKLAHKTCKISNEDIDRLASIYGLQNEQGSRDALNE